MCVGYKHFFLRLVKIYCYARSYKKKTSGGLNEKRLVIIQNVLMIFVIRLYGLVSQPIPICGGGQASSIMADGMSTRLVIVNLACDARRDFAPTSVLLLSLSET